MKRYGLFAFMLLRVCDQRATGGQEVALTNESIQVVHFEALEHHLLDRMKSKAATGTVVVRVELDHRGDVLVANVLSGPKDLISQCRANAKKWKFRPNSQNAAILVYWFRRSGLCNRPCPSQFSFEPPNLAIISMGDPVVQP